jgi:hypothetical protein
MNTNGYNTRGRNNSNTAIFINNNDDIIEGVDENINHLDDEVDDEEEDTIIQSLSSNNNAAASLLADEILANRVVNKTREQYERTLKFLAATCSNICPEAICTENAEAILKLPMEMDHIKLIFGHMSLDREDKSIKSKSTVTGYDVQNYIVYVMLLGFQLFYY